MEKLKQYKYIIFVGLVILGLSFYWYEYRPSNIKKDCYNLAVEKAKNKRNTEEQVKEDRFNKDDYDAYYKWCLQAKGL